MKFDWDIDKARSNKSKHGVTFDEAESVYFDPYRLTAHDVWHSDAEDRELTIGLSYRLRVLLVVTTMTDADTIRIVSARKATPREATQYETRRNQAQDS